MGSRRWSRQFSLWHPLDATDKTSSDLQEDRQPEGGSASSWTEQRLCVFQIGGVEALGERAVDRARRLRASARRRCSPHSRAWLVAARNSNNFACWARAMRSACCKQAWPSSSLFSASSTVPERCSSPSRLVLAGGVRYFQSLPQCGQCRRPVAAARQTLGQARQAKRQI